MTERPSTSRGLEENEEKEEKSPFKNRLKKLPSRLLKGGGSVVSEVSSCGDTVVSVKSLRKPEVIAELPVLTEEQKLRAMLGFRDEDFNKVCHCLLLQ